MSTITITPTVIHLDSEFQHIDLMTTNQVINVNAEYPTSPIFENLTVTGDVEIGDDLDVIDNVYIGDSLTVEDQINTQNLMCNTEAFFVDIDVAGETTLVGASIGAVSNGNYSEFETDGTLVHHGLAMVHEDLNFDVVNSGGPASGVPDPVLINNVYYREFTSANNQHCSACKEFPHAAYIYAAQSLIAHTHIFLKAAESAGTTGVTFTIYWELRQTTGTTNGSVTVSATSAQLAANTHKIDLYAATGFTGPIELNAQLTMRLARTGGNAGDVIATTYGVHYTKDAGGSRTATSK